MEQERSYTLRLVVEIDGYGKDAHITKTAYEAAKALHYSFQTSGVRVFNATNPELVPTLVEFNAAKDDGNEPDECAIVSDEEMAAFGTRLGYRQSGPEMVWVSPEGARSIDGSYAAALRQNGVGT